MIIVWLFIIAGLTVLSTFVVLSKREVRKRELAAAKLGRVAKEGLLKLGLSPEDLAHDEQMIDDVLDDLTDPHSRIILQNFAAHTAKYRTEVIEDASLGCILSGMPTPDQLTDSHITVHRDIERALSETNIFTTGKNGDEVSENLAVNEYAMNHIEDGYLILSLIHDRRCGTLEEVINGLSVLKDSEPGALSAGAL